MKALSFYKVMIKIIIASLFVLLVGCGESNDVVSNTRIGQLIDGESINELLYYATETHSGNISLTGEFVYEPGENITIYDGNILIGKTKAMDVVSSYSLMGEVSSVNAYND